jgi:hypothetical protein
MEDIRRPDRPQRRDYAIPAQPAHRPHAPHPPHPQQPVHHQTPQPPTHHQPKAHRRYGGKLLIGGGAAAIAIGLFAGGYLLKSSNTANTIPPSIVKQANFDVYFPSPMPPGYTYMKDTATFAIGDVFYKFSNGTKRVTVKEQPINGNKPDLNLLVGYTQFDLPFGRAAVGTSIGQPAAVVVTNTTVISLNGVGGVTQNDLKAAINNFKNIGQNTQKS